MNLDQQVCSLELSKKLKELGIKQESILSWIKKTDDSWVVTSYYGCDCWVENRGDVIMPGFVHEEYAAFTVAELGEMLPYEISVNNIKYNYASSKICKSKSVRKISHSVYFENLQKESIFHIEWGHTESDARAQILIRLIEEGIVNNE